eukprot:946329-Prymnesium_polylepis.1
MQHSSNQANEMDSGRRREELDQFCQRAETSATPTAFYSVRISNRSKDAARLHRQKLGSPCHTNVNRGKH